MILLGANLKTFLAVVENSTVSAAAKKLGLTQTGTTQRIQALESELGVALFLRSRSGMKLTPEGATLLRHCTYVSELEGRLTSEVRRGGLEHDVEIALTGPGGLLARRIIPQCAKVAEKWPRLNFRFIAEPHATRIRMLKRGLADFAIVMPHEVKNEMDSKMIAPNEMVLVASAGWRDRKLHDILKNERLVTYHQEDPLALDYLKEFDLLESLGRARLLANDNEMVISLVRLRMGFALLPKELVQPRIEKRELIALNAGRSMKIPMALTWYPRNQMPEYFRELIRAIK